MSESKEDQAQFREDLNLLVKAVANALKREVEERKLRMEGEPLPYRNQVRVKDLEEIDWSKVRWEKLENDLVDPLDEEKENTKGQEGQDGQENPEIENKVEK
jgi:hypothetical protein